MVLVVQMWNTSGDVSTMPSKEVTFGNSCTRIAEWGLKGSIWYRRGWVSSVRRRWPLGRTAMFSIHWGGGGLVVGGLSKGRC